MTVIRVHDEAVVTAVEGVGRQVGYADAPNGALDSLIAGTGPGYYIVYPLPGGDRDGPASDPWADIELVYQVTCVDQGPEGARWLSDQLESRIAAVSIADRKVLWVRPQNSGVWPDHDTAAQPIYSSTPIFRIATTPTGS